VFAHIASTTSFVKVFGAVEVPTKIVGLTVYVWNWDFESLQKTSIDGYVKLPFEDTEFYAPQGYIEYLENTFGDYMTPPPEDRRVSHHNFNVYWKNK